jgi:protein-S-isoprenylcysteine O-methyltransferase Ste14
MIKIIAFVVLSIPLICVSRTSLLSPRSHGFSRFFAWECILVLILLNITHWFHDPFSWYQILSWVLLFGSFVPLILGVRGLATQGKQVRQREGGPELYAFEKTSVLITTGIYRHIRHPMYSSLLLLTWGVFFKFPTWIGFLAALAASGFLYMTARADEAECIRFFGPSYREYMRSTKRFLPFLF